MNEAFMNIGRIEGILRRAPSPKAPEDLLNKLKADIRLARADVTETAEWSEPASWMRRWLPALSFAAMMLTCLVAIGVQTNILSQLQKENGELRAATGNLEALRAENAEYQKLAQANLELDRLRKDKAELAKLRGDAGQMTAQLQDAGTVRAENQRLRASMKQAGGAGASGDFFAGAKEKAERNMCMNNLKQVGLAMRLWAGDNGGVGPPNFICMTNELSTWKILQCPGDKAHNVTNWADVEAGNISYIMDAPGASLAGPGFIPTMIFVECPVHHNVCLMDGSVQQMSAEWYNRIKVVDGKKILEPR